MKKFDKKIPHFCGLWRFYLIITVEDPSRDAAVVKVMLKNLLEEYFYAE